MRILHVFLEACRCVLHEPVLCLPAKNGSFGIWSEGIPPTVALCGGG